MLCCYGYPVAHRHVTKLRTAVVFQSPDTRYLVRNMATLTKMLPPSWDESEVSLVVSVCPLVDGWIDRPRKNSKTTTQHSIKTKRSKTKRNKEGSPWGTHISGPGFSRPFGPFIVRAVGQLFGWSVIRSVGSLICHSVGESVSWSVGWLVIRSFGYLVGQSENHSVVVLVR